MELREQVDHGKNLPLNWPNGLTVKSLMSKMALVRQTDSFSADALLSELKSGYPNYPKSGYIRTILVTEYQCPNFGYSKSLFLE